MAYNANTNWDNEKKYLESLISGGTAGQAAWATNQLNELNTAQNTYSPTTSTSTTTTTPTTSSSSGYTALGTHNDATVKSQSQSDADLIQYWKDQWSAAQQAGDTAGMETAHAAAEAIRQGYGYSGGTDGSDYLGLLEEEAVMPSFTYDTTSRPTYESTYSTQIDDLLNQILTRDDFSYDYTTDPLYTQYKQQYLREGSRAMDDTLASAAASAGGMNSYAINAAQQAANYYNSQLNDVLPELYQMAYDMYLTDIDNQVRDLGLLNDMDYTQYSRYRDTMSDWENDRDFAYNQYRDSVSDYYTDLGLATDNSRYENEWNYNTSANDQATAYQQAMDFLNAGVMPSASILSAAGISTSEAQAYINRVLALDSVSSSGSGSSSKRTSSVTDEDNETKNTTAATPKKSEAYYSVVKQVRNMYDAGKSADDIEDVIVQALEAGIMSNTEAVSLAERYGVKL